MSGQSHSMFERARLIEEVIKDLPPGPWTLSVERMSDGNDFYVKSGALDVAFACDTEKGLPDKPRRAVAVFVTEAHALLPWLLRERDCLTQALRDVVRAPGTLPAFKLREIAAKGYNGGP